MDDVFEALLADLMVRTCQAVQDVGHLAAQTGIPFETDDVVNIVLRRLSADHPGLKTMSVAMLRTSVAELARTFWDREEA
ncbi:hypothetical protein ACH4LN_32160 [Streptomyces albus]|uniref:Uncharacterized protein n=1 Tax=Streptomyces albus TaxID=1888 RepID=A0A6C1C9U4_9ACTN|nr:MULTISPECIES: hypothetical protein [Streptomyces]QID39798.1 hypothetical protein G3260_006744 [Streptomyces albus]TGG83802.1 hypothetical protein D8771_13840 [Streptomyces albus]UVN53088.1 hypothetical protein NR995_00165 [Streptomyces albus]GHJ19092.1 hypothetical protein TPA0909_07060 [Streptomyces albus]